VVLDARADEPIDGGADGQHLLELVEDDERAPFGALVELGREVEQLEQSLLGGADRGDRGDLDPDTG